MNESKFDKQVKEIKNYLERDDKKCLVINGSWGIGKTYLWKKAEDKLSRTKKVVYIDLFGKESYKQILEEIVFKVNGKINERLKILLKFSSKIPSKITDIIKIGAEALFSLLERKDFTNIIVCFDNIERKSDNLALKDIIGLVNLLKEDKECNVVMIFNKEELNKLEFENKELNESKNKKPNEPQNKKTDFGEMLDKELNKLANKESDEPEDKESNWYETYKEKFVDYEFTIDNNYEVAKDIIKTKLNEERKDGNKHEEHKERVEEIIFELFKRLCDNNLRLLFKFIEHIRYFNQECFFIKHYDKDDEVFFQTLEFYYKHLLNRIKKYYSLKISEEESKFIIGREIAFQVFQSYFDNFFNLSQEDLRTLTNSFESKIEYNRENFFEKCKDNYLFGNLNDQEFVECIQKFFSKFENFACEFRIETFNDYKNFFKTYEEITGEKLDCEEKFDKFFIEALVKQEFVFHEKSDENSELKKAIDGIKEVIDENEKYKEYYEKLKKEKYKNSNNSIEAFLYDLEPKQIRVYLSYSHIQKFNDFTIDSIEKYFQKNNEFCKTFCDDFKNLLKSGSKFEKYDLNNNLFQAYKNFLNRNENKIKKECVRKILGEKYHYCLLLKLLEK